MLTRPPGPWASSPPPSLNLLPRKDRRGPNAVRGAGWTSISPPAPVTAWLHPLNSALRAAPRPAWPGFPQRLWPPTSAAAGLGQQLRRGFDTGERWPRRRLQTLQSRARGRLCMQTPSPPRAPRMPDPASGAGPPERGGAIGVVRGQRGGARVHSTPPLGRGQRGGLGQRGGARALSRSEPLGSFLSPSGARRRILPRRKSPGRPAPPPSPTFSAVY